MVKAWHKICLYDFPLIKINWVDNTADQIVITVLNDLSSLTVNQLMIYIYIHMSALSQVPKLDHLP